MPGQHFLSTGFNIISPASPFPCQYRWRSDSQPGREKCKSCRCRHTLGPSASLSRSSPYCTVTAKSVGCRTPEKLWCTQEQIQISNQYSDRDLYKASTPSRFTCGSHATHPWYETVRPATSALSQWMKNWMQSMQKEPREAAMDTLAAPMTPSLKRFSTKPPVMMPKATAGRFRIPGGRVDQYSGVTLRRRYHAGYTLWPYLKKCVTQIQTL